jgi:hypothetical protein
MRRTIVLGLAAIRRPHGADALLTRSCG